jgi:hypothetical protein
LIRAAANAGVSSSYVNEKWADGLAFSEHSTN